MFFCQSQCWWGARFAFLQVWFSLALFKVFFFKTFPYFCLYPHALKERSIPLTLFYRPVPFTCGHFDGRLLADPSLDELPALSSLTTCAFREDGALCFFSDVGLKYTNKEYIHLSFILILYPPSITYLLIQLTFSGSGLSLEQVQTIVSLGKEKAAQFRQLLLF